MSSDSRLLKARSLREEKIYSADMGQNYTLINVLRRLKQFFALGIVATGIWLAQTFSYVGITLATFFPIVSPIAVPILASIAGYISYLGINKRHDNISKDDSSKGRWEFVISAALGLVVMAIGLIVGVGVLNPATIQFTAVNIGYIVVSGLTFFAIALDLSVRHIFGRTKEYESNRNDETFRELSEDSGESNESSTRDYHKSTWGDFHQFDVGNYKVDSESITSDGVEAGLTSGEISPRSSSLTSNSFLSNCNSGLSDSTRSSCDETSSESASDAVSLSDSSNVGHQYGSK